MAQVTNIEIKKDKNNNDYKSATLDEVIHGKNRFNVFLKHTRYNDVLVGANFAPTDFVQDGQYINLADPDKGAKKGYTRGVDPVQVAVAQERTRGNVREAQDNKEYGIKVSSTFSSATAITVELMKEDKLTEWHTLHQQVRAKLWEMWDMDKGTQGVY